jgi:hypothetical protein
LTVPYEQITQQSPGNGLSNSPQPAHSWKCVHESVGITSTLEWPQTGQASVEERSTAVACGGLA